ncbi:MAG: hypothetical protein M3Y75_08690 [Actinomycetota bacterium]|nr:hypothetical protein [Actinomycetota bacterium]
MREAIAKSWGMLSTTFWIEAGSFSGASPAPVPWLIASAISLPTSLGTPLESAVASRLERFSRIRI